MLKLLMKCIKYLHDKTHACTIHHEVLILLICVCQNRHKKGKKARNMPNLCFHYSGSHHPTSSCTSCKISLAKNRLSPSSTWGFVIDVTWPRSPEANNKQLMEQTHGDLIHQRKPAFIGTKRAIGQY